MLKLSLYNGGKPCFVNPRRVTSIIERQVRDPDNDPPRLPNAVWRQAMRVEGCLIEFGGPEDSGIAVMESAELVAEFVADGNASWADGGVIDVAAALAKRKAADDAKAAGKCLECGKAEADCDCLPF